MYKLSLLVIVGVLVVSEAFPPIAPEIHVPKPYSFGYTVKDKHGEQHREETGDGAGVVKGSYGFTDERGVHRLVNYVADKAGFRAEVKTNEHGTAPQDPAAVKMISSAHPYLGGAGGIGVKGAPIAAAIAPHAAGAFGPRGVGPFTAAVAPLAADAFGPYGVGSFTAAASLPGAGAFGPHGIGPFTAGSLAFGAPVPAAGLAKEDIAIGYGEPFLGGAFKGYDTRFGAY